MNKLVLVAMFIFGAMGANAQNVEKKNAYTVKVDGMSQIKYRVVAKTISDGCNGIWLEIFEINKLSKSGAKKAILDLNTGYAQTLMECYNNDSNPVTLESEWKVQNISSAKEITFIVAENEKVEVEGLKVAKQSVVTINVEGMNSIQFRVLENIMADSCNSYGIDSVELQKLSKNGATTAVLVPKVQSSQTVMGCNSNKMHKETLVSDWKTLKITSAKEISFLLGKNQSIEIQ